MFADPATTEHEVQYLLHGNGGADISYWDGSNIVKESVSLPWQKTVTLTGTDFQIAVDSIQLGRGKGSTCQILVDGKVAITKEGGLVGVSCNMAYSVNK